MNLQQNAPSLAQFIKAFAVANGITTDSVEMIRQPLYDRAVYPAAGLAGGLSFFQSPIGNGQTAESGAAASTAKSFADTNMTQQGQLPSPQAFWVDSIQVDIDAGSVSTATLFVTEPPTFFNTTAAATVQGGANDKNALLNAGYLSFSIGQKNYLQLGPLKRFPPAVNLRMDTSSSLAGTNNQPAAFGAQLLRSEGVPGLPFFKMDPGVSIPTSMNFAVNLNFPVAIATPSGFNARIQVLLDGFLIRAIQ